MSDEMITFRGGPLDGDALPVRTTTVVVTVPIPERGVVVDYFRMEGWEARSSRLPTDDAERRALLTS